MAIAAVLCFFPVLVNTLRGLQSVRPAQIELMRSYAASELEIFRRVRVPTALPYVFTALKVASVLAMIGAIVGEYFGGSFHALGVQIRSDAQIFDFALAWAAIVVASLLGIALYLAVAAAERALVRWAPANRSYETPSNELADNPRQRIDPNEKRRTYEKTLGDVARRPPARCVALAVGAAASAAPRARAGGQGHAAAQVGAAGAVRRLLRGAEEGYYKKAGLDVSQGRRPGHHPRAGRRERPGAVRRRLAAEPARRA